MNAIFIIVCTKPACTPQARFSGQPLASAAGGRGRETPPAPRPGLCLKHKIHQFHYTIHRFKCIHAEFKTHRRRMRTRCRRSHPRLAPAITQRDYTTSEQETEGSTANCCINAICFRKFLLESIARISLQSGHFNASIRSMCTVVYVPGPRA